MSHSQQLFWRCPPQIFLHLSSGGFLKFSIPMAQLVTFVAGQELAFYKCVFFWQIQTFSVKYSIISNKHFQLKRKH